MKRRARWLVFLGVVGWGIATSCAPAAERSSKPAPTRGADARAALCTLSLRTLARPAPAKRLFVEGYFMRSLVAAVEAAPCSGDSAWMKRAVGRAVAWADTLAATQDAHGFWRIGYESGWVADMAAAVLLYPAVELYVDAARRDRYVASAEKFIAALERDGLLLPTGAVGIGWPLGERPANTVRAWRSDAGWSDSTYLVSTSLAGVAVQSWLWKRTAKPAYRDRAARAFDVTIASVQADGSLPLRGPGEGPHGVAAYVEEGWMAASDAGVLDAPRRERFQPALMRHLGWLDRTQTPDGLWDSGVRGDPARAVAIVDFLVWLETTGLLDARDCSMCHQSAAALAASVGADPAGPPRDDDHEVWRAHAGRALAAIVLERGVP